MSFRVAQVFHVRVAEIIYLGLLIDAGYKKKSPISFRVAKVFHFRVAEMIHLGLLSGAGHSRNFQISFRVAVVFGFIVWSSTDVRSMPAASSVPRFGSVAFSCIKTILNSSIFGFMYGMP